MGVTGLCKLLYDFYVAHLVMLYFLCVAYAGLVVDMIRAPPPLLVIPWGHIFFARFSTLSLVI